MSEVDCTISNDGVTETVTVTSGSVVLSAQYPMDDALAALLAYDATDNLRQAVAVAILVATGVPFDTAKELVESLS